MGFDSYGISSISMTHVTGQKGVQNIENQWSCWGYHLVHFLVLPLMIKLYNSIKTTLN